MRRMLLLPLLFILGIAPIFSQSDPFGYLDIENGERINVVVHSQGLEDNLLGDSPDRNVSIYLPPGYNISPGSYYPVVYFLHGFGQDYYTWWGGGIFNTDFRAVLNDLIPNIGLTPMIVVVPSSFNKYRGSWYTNSSVTGDWEDFITKDLVKYVDDNYRTLAGAGSRGISGHSMGGYGTIKIGMRNPGLFSTAYALSPAYMVFEDVILGTMKDYLISAVNSDYFLSLSWEAQTTIAGAAAFAPNHNSLPYYGEFPVDTSGVLIDSIWQKWLLHDPYTMIPGYKDSLLALQVLRYDCGTSDYLLYNSNVRFSQALEDHGIPHIFEQYQGDHINKIWQRVEEELFPFFSKRLDHIVPGICIRSSWYLDSSDTLILNMDKKGMVYIVPRNTYGVLDSIHEKQIYSIAANADSDVNILISEIEYGDYFAYGIDEITSGVSIPIPFAAVENKLPPVLTLENDTIVRGDSIFVTSNKDGKIYLVRAGTPFDRIDRNPFAISEVNAGQSVGFSSTDLSSTRYWFYAQDYYGYTSESYQVNLRDASGQINHFTDRIKILPNPVYDVLSIKTDYPDRYTIKIISLSGQLIYSTEMEGRTHQINMSPFSKGVYFVAVRSKEFVRTDKVVKL